jgi:predicted MFS family arabinose efflux permease
MAATLVPLAGPVLPSLAVLTSLLVLHALAAAIQDVSIDSLAIRATTPDERGKTTASMQVGLRSGRFLFGAAALWLSARYGVRPIVFALIGVLLAGAALSTCYTVPRRPAEAGASSFRVALARAARIRTTWIGLLFAAVGGAGFEATAGVARTFLSSRGLSRDDIALQFALPGMLLMAVGAWLGGPFADRHGRIRATFLAGTSVSIAVAAVAATAGLAASAPVLVALLALHVTIGMFTASSYALFMDLTDRRIAATQFSAFMGATNACESWSIALCGSWAASAGYPTSFARFAVLGSLAMLLLLLLRRGPR